MASPIKNMSGDDIYQELKSDILSLRIEPGQYLSENEVSQRFHVSRTPVKYAFLRLMSENFINIVPQKGSYVTLLDLDLIKDIIYMRNTLELDVLKSVIGKITPEYYQKLEENLELQAEITKQADIIPEEFYRIDSEFHSLFFQFAGRSKLWGVIQEFQLYYTRFRMLDVVATKRYKELYEEHLKLLDIMKDENTKLLEKELYDHLHNNIKRLSPRIEGELQHYFI